MRARDKSSLINLASRCGAEIAHTPFADYPYRVSTTNKEFSAWLTGQAEEITYRNFKSEVEVTRGFSFVKALHKVWDVMHDVEDREARVR